MFNAIEDFSDYDMDDEELYSLLNDIVYEDNNQRKDQGKHCWWLNEFTGFF